MIEKNQAPTNSRDKLYLLFFLVIVCIDRALYVMHFE
jgi:hypothetical protein